MNSPSKQLGQLIDELREVNQELNKAARPLRSPSELDDEQRQRIGDGIRAGAGLLADAPGDAPVCVA